MNDRFIFGRWAWAGALLASCGTDANQDAAPQDVAAVDTGNTADALDAALDAQPDNVAPDVSADHPLGDGTMLADASDVMAGTDVTDVGPYPAGPYGNAMGNILANLNWVGYENPTGHVRSDTLPYGPTSMQAQRMLGRRYGLVHVSEFY